MATDIPAALTVPDRVETRPGTLAFRDGFPDDATVAKVYDTQTRSLLRTDQRFPSLGSLRPDLVVNADGAVDIAFGPQPPPGGAHNWVQTWPGKGWSVSLRLYGPLAPWFDQTWRPGELDPVAD